jgi:hypothetical protein
MNRAPDCVKRFVKKGENVFDKGIDKAVHRVNILP